jgi:2-iminobutanoate/2-iminopropanoate deaminase
LETFVAMVASGTMTKPIVSSFQLPWARGFDFASSVRVDDLLVVSGQTGHRSDGTLPEDFEVQLRQAFVNLDDVLRAQGGSLDTIVRLTTYFARTEDYAVFKRVRPEVLKAPFPASTGVVAGLLFPGMLVELEAIAVRGEARVSEEASADRPD